MRSFVNIKYFSVKIPFSLFEISFCERRRNVFSTECVSVLMSTCMHKYNRIYVSHLYYDHFILIIENMINNFLFRKMNIKIMNPLNVLLLDTVEVQIRVTV